MGADNHFTTVPENYDDGKTLAVADLSGYVCDDCATTACDAYRGRECPQRRCGGTVVRIDDVRLVADE